MRGRRSGRQDFVAIEVALDAQQDGGVVVNDSDVGH
jgi:hypothetical protein